MMSFSSSHLLSTNSVSIPSAVQRSWIQRRRIFVEFVASRIAMTPLPTANHLTMSSTAASAAARRRRSPSGFEVSKKSAVGAGVAARRYEPTLKVLASMESQRRYRITLSQCPKLALEPQVPSPRAENPLTFLGYQALAACGKSDHHHANPRVLDLHAESVNIRVHCCWLGCTVRAAAA
jgi:hypothetical protein